MLKGFSLILQRKLLPHSALITKVIEPMQHRPKEFGNLRNLIQALAPSL
jgi:hypothetical protein